MYRYCDIRKLHLEITDKCNAACPQCPRNQQGGRTNPTLPLVELSLGDIIKIIPESLAKQLHSVWCAGTYGDAIVARDTLPILQYLRGANPDICLGLHTNGSARSAEWWRDLGRVLPLGKGYVRFGIDGLEATNHLYRRNTKWGIVMRNVRAFIAAGGNAEWDFLVFRHNEHQVGEARALAKELGFTAFNCKASARFFSLSSSHPIDRTPVKDREGKVEYWLERPSNPQWNNDALLNIKSNSKRYGSLLAYLDKTGISCKAAKEQSISISAEGYVLPCCWLGGEVLNKHTNEPFATLVKSAGGWDKINAKYNSVREIVEGPFYSKLLPSSWARPSLARGKIFTCAMVCGSDPALDMRSQQWKRQERLL